MLPSKQRGGGRVNHDPCGCQYQDCRYLVLCPTHRAEFEERHKQAFEEYRANRAPKVAGESHG